MKFKLLFVSFFSLINLIGLVANAQHARDLRGAKNIVIEASSFAWHCNYSGNSSGSSLISKDLTVDFGSSSKYPVSYREIESICNNFNTRVHDTRVTIVIGYTSSSIGNVVDYIGYFYNDSYKICMDKGFERIIYVCFEELIIPERSRK